MEHFGNIVLTVFAMMMSLFIVGLVHEIGHYFVARVVMKEPNVKITMGFFGKTIFNSKRFKINSVFFFGAYVGNYSDGEINRLHMALLFSSGAFFTFLFGIPVALYMSGGNMGLGDFLPLLFQASPLRDNLLSVQVVQTGFVFPWLSLSTPLDFFNVFMLYLRMLIPWMIIIPILPYAYPLKLHGKWHWNPSDGVWVLKFIFNKISEKDIENATTAINEKTD